MKWVRLGHRWLGLILSVFVIIISVTGGTLVFKEHILRVAWPELSTKITAEQKTAYPKLLSQLEDKYQEGDIAFVRFPREGMNVLQVWLKDESQLYISPVSGETIRHWRWNDSFISLITDGAYLLHSHLLSGERGEIVVGCIGIIIMLFVFSGLFLWWPRRKGFSLKEVLPKKATAKFYIRSHNTIGVISSAFIILFVVTGVTMVFYKPIAFAVVSVIDPEMPKLPNAKVKPKKEQIKLWEEIMAVVNKTLPKGALLSYTSHSKDNAAMVFRKRMPEEWHEYGRSFILLDPYTAEVVQIIDARQQHTGMRLMEKIYPLHASKIGGLPFKLLAMTTAIMMLMMTVFGVMSYVARYRGGK
jgi:uncharacterized iron-regulated membrane protein